jgi:hypothetical protein
VPISVIPAKASQKEIVSRVSILLTDDAMLERPLTEQWQMILCGVPLVSASFPLLDRHPSDVDPIRCAAWYSAGRLLPDPFCAYTG